MKDLKEQSEFQTVILLQISLNKLNRITVCRLEKLGAQINCFVFIKLRTYFGHFLQKTFNNIAFMFIIKE
jgi:hypothetical protein